MPTHCISRTILALALLGAAAAQDAGKPPAWRLLETQSPYLRAHATDPVEWWPWSEAAFARAKELDRPVFLTIGYMACHWCHRMQHDTFQDAEVARRLNEKYVCIAVDREERPDIDARFQNALVLMSRNGGGWPASLILLPDGRPFFGGTYYPAEDGPLGQGLRSLLDRIGELWDTDRDTVIGAADELHQYLATDPLALNDAAADLDLRALLDGSVTLLTGQLDATWGGQRGAPKFPPTQLLSFLLRQHQRTGVTVGDLLGVSLDAMSCGGLADHVGGGFFRYCMDEHWDIPHFEKMLPENAEIAALYAEAAVVLDEARWREPALQTLAWARREMRLPTGLFASSLDADSPPFDDAADDGAAGDVVPRAGGRSEEGRFYLWNPGELVAVLGDRDGPAFAQLYRVLDEGSFVTMEGATGLSLPRAQRTVPAMAAKPGVEVKPGDEFVRWRRHALDRLLEARERRPRPARDDKALASANGLLLTAFARAGALLDDATCRVEAAALAKALRTRLVARDEALPRVLHQEFAGQASGRGDLSDTAAVALGLLDAHDVNGDPALLLDAFALARGLLSRFGDPAGGFFDTEGSDPLLPDRGRNPWDGPVPAGSSLAVELLLRLSPLDDSGAFASEAQRAIVRLAPLAIRGPDGFPALLSAADAAQGPLAEVVIDGSGDALAALQHALRTRALPAALRLPDARALATALDAERAAAKAAGRAPLFAEPPSLLAERHAPDGEARAWVCVQRACLLPAATPEELAARLDEVVQRPPAPAPTPAGPESSP